MLKFPVNFRKLASDLMPFFLRDPQTVKLIEHPNSALQEVNDNLVTFRDGISFDLSFTSGKAYLQEVLNQLFDPIDRGIFIENQTDFLADNFIKFDVESGTDDFTYFESEGKPPRFYYLESEYAIAVTFIVFVPAALVFDQDEMEALVNKYRAAGRPFEIQTY